MENNKNMIITVPFSELKIWDVKSFYHQSDIFNKKYPVVLFGEFLTKPIISKVQIEDTKEYKILGARAYGKGAFVNRTVKGDTLKMRTYQQAKPNHLFWCKVDTKNGAFGIITEELADGVASSNMTFAKIETEKANPEFLQLLFKSKRINEYMDGYVSGTTNRKYIKPDQLREEIKIVLPPIEEQNRIVANYNTRITLAEKQLNEANNLEIEIDNFLFEILDLKKLSDKEVQKGLSFVNFKNIDRWDVLAKDLRILNGLAKSKFELKSLGSVLNFPSRSWNKKNLSSENFNYIELGAIDPNFGITEIKNIKVKEAPSRATQMVKEGDLIIGTTRPYLKRFAIIEEKHNNYICSSGFCIIEENSNYNLDYIKEFMMSYYGIEQLKNRMSGGTYPAITNSELKEVFIPFPPIEIQNQIGDKLKNTKSKIKHLLNESETNSMNALIEFENEIFNS
jgi:restriction endonuclease S subunit